MFFYIKNITNLKKGGNLPPISKYPPEKVYMKVLCTTKVRTTITEEANVK